MIVDKNAKPMGIKSDYPGAYPKKSVKLLIEVKASGLYYPNKTFISTLQQHFQKIQGAVGKPSLYLSIWESAPKSAMTRTVLGNSAFILKEGNRIIQNEWQNFVNTVIATIKACEIWC